MQDCHWTIIIVHSCTHEPFFLRILFRNSMSFSLQTTKSYLIANAFAVWELPGLNRSDGRALVSEAVFASCVSKHSSNLRPPSLNSYFSKYPWSHLYTYPWLSHSALQTYTSIFVNCYCGHKDINRKMSTKPPDSWGPDLHFCNDADWIEKSWVLFFRKKLKNYCWKASLSQQFKWSNQ